MHEKAPEISSAKWRSFYPGWDGGGGGEYTRNYTKIQLWSYLFVDFSCVHHRKSRDKYDLLYDLMIKPMGSIGASSYEQ